MITDDDKKAASRYAHQQGPKKMSLVAHLAFLAGVAHARKPHVVADGDLPKECQKVVAITDSNNPYILWWEFLINDLSIGIYIKTT